MKIVFLMTVIVLAASAIAMAKDPAAETFRGKVYQVDTVFDNIDVILPGGKRTFWTNAATQVRVHRKRAQLIDIAMGDEVRGTYTTGAKGALVLVTIEDVTGN